MCVCVYFASGALGKGRPVGSAVRIPYNTWRFAELFATLSTPGQEREKERNSAESQLSLTWRLVGENENEKKKRERERELPESYLLLLQSSIRRAIWQIAIAQKSI